MNGFDWRDLYAANLAAIDAAQTTEPSARPSGPRPPRSGKARLPKGFRVPEGFRVSDLPGQGDPRPDRRPGGTGSWEQHRYEGAGGSRPYFVYTPAHLPAGTAAPLVVVLHGCTQTPSSIARGTGMNQLADRHGFVVAYPQQTREHNDQSCWNWFLPHHQGRSSGEPALLAGITNEVLTSTGATTLDPGRVFLAGMSAGGAMASVMGATFPDLLAGIGVHSGLAFRAAQSTETAYMAMARGVSDAGGRGREAFRAMGSHARIVPTVVVHGTSDRVVAPRNGEQVVEQWLTTNRLVTNGRFDGELGRPSSVVHGQADGGHAYTRSRWHDRGGALVQEYLDVSGLGHAWSGGIEGAGYTDPRGPEASQAMWDFFREARQG